MFYKTTILGAALALVGLAAAAPTPTTSSTSAFITGYPLCGIPGYHRVPGNYTQWTYQVSNMSLNACMDTCRAQAPTCLGLEFTRDGECIFFDTVIAGTQLELDYDSAFISFDLPCPIPSGV